jgi:glycosyltransferase involved in cell wall biosynthesis
MDRPRFSVVIPTRERAETLLHSLRTCTEQDFDDYEVVVCDNCGSPATRRVVEDCGSAKVRYVRSDRPLAMSDNWDLALSHATGEYVTVLGDDDGLLPCALRELSRLVERHGRPGAVHWFAGLYTWPSIAVPEEANFLRLPTDRCCRTLDGRDQLKRVARYEFGAEHLPMIYRAVIRSDLIERHRRAAGRVFPTLYPDVYSGYAFAWLAGTYVSVQVPLSVAGLSGKSNGVAVLMRTDDNPIAEEFNRLHRQAGFVRHRTVPDVELLPVNADDSFQYARDLFFADDPELVLDRKRAAECYLAAIPDADPAVRARVRGQIRAALADRPDLLGWFDGAADPGPCPPYRCRPGPFGFDGWGLTLDARRFGVSDVAGAVRLATDVLGFGSGEIRYDLPTRQMADEAWSMALADREGRLRQAEAALQAAENRVDLSEREVATLRRRVEEADGARRQLAQQNEAIQRQLAQQNEALQRQLAHAVREGSLRNVPRRVFRKVAGLWAAGT